MSSFPSAYSFLHFEPIAECCIIPYTLVSFTQMKTLFGMMLKLMNFYIILRIQCSALHTIYAQNTLRQSIKFPLKQMFSFVSLFVYSSVCIRTCPLFPNLSVKNSVCSYIRYMISKYFAMVSVQRICCFFRCVLTDQMYK